jgi:hypothetical protein
LDQQQIDDQVLELVARMDLQRATFLLAKVADQLFARMALPSPNSTPMGFISVSKGETVVIAAGGGQAGPLRAFALNMQAQMRVSPLTGRMVEFDGDRDSDMPRR